MDARLFVKNMSAACKNVARIVCGVSLASVTGRTYAGREIRGTDSIKLIGCD
jgi:hypothetical protein